MIDESDLQRLIEGDCTPDEAAALQAWVAADPARARRLDELQSVWRLTGDRTRDWNAAEARRRLLEAVNQSGGARILKLIPPSRLPGAMPWWRPVALAASVAVVAVAFWALERRDPPYREYATAAGQLSELTLSDGSRVILGVDTRLRVPKDFAARSRTLEIEGEAYFIVRHDDRLPFIVRTRRGTVEDLGTEFDVRDYPEESQVQVVVAAGRVRWQGDTPSRVLRRRDRAVIDARGGVRVTSGITLDHYVGWIRRRLVFDDAPLAAVLAQLQRWYDLDIQSADSSLYDARVTISFTTESPDEALGALAQVLNIRFTRAGRAVRLAPARAR